MQLKWTLLFIGFVVQIWLKLILLQLSGSVGLWFRETIVNDELLDETGRSFRGPREIRIREVNVVQPKPDVITKGPFKVIQQSPGSVSPDIAAVQIDSWRENMMNVFS